MPKKILVVDNNPVILKLMENFLAKEGHEVKTAIDGIVALDTLRDFLAEVIFVDLIMPKLSGEKLCMIIRQMPEMRGVVLVVLSAAAVEQQIDFVSFGADACIAKGPFKEVENHIRHVFAKIDSGELGDLTQGIIGVEHVFQRIVTTELLSSKRHFEVTLNTMAEGFVELTATGLIVYVNPMAVAFAGVPEAKMLAKDFLDFFGGQQYTELAECLARLDKTPVVIGEQKPFLLNGRYLAMTLAPIVELEQMVVIVLIRDITERKKAEQEMALYRDHLEDLVQQRSAELLARNKELQLEIEERQRLAKAKEALEIELMQRHKMEALGVMATGIVHDFNNILTAMLGYAEVIRYTSCAEDRKTLEYLKNIAIAGNRGKELIGLIKTFSRPADHPFLDVHVAQVVADTLLLLSPSVPPNVEVIKEVATAIPPVLGDPVQIQQILLNLCTNGLQAMRDKGGRLTIALSPVTPGAGGIVAAYPEGQWVELSVADTGIGIPPENLDKIFDPYFTTRAGGDGTGLGLAVVQGIVIRHGGRIVVNSQPGQGAMFSVYLPAVTTGGRNTGGSADGGDPSSSQTISAGPVH